jgi:phasin family protein
MSALNGWLSTKLHDRISVSKAARPLIFHRINFCAAHKNLLTLLHRNIIVHCNKLRWCEAMASKVEASATTAPAKAAKKAAPVKKPAVEQVAAPAPKAEKLVTRIISVNETPISNGVSKMTETVEKTAKEAQAKAADFFADMREKAAEAAEKGKKFAAEAAEFNKANIEAMVEAGKIAAKGAQELGQTNLEYAKKNFEDMQAAIKEVTGVKNPTDFVKLQGEWMRKGFDTAVAQGSKNTEAMVKLANDMFQPISNRFAVAADYFKKAA